MNDGSPIAHSLTPERSAQRFDRAEVTAIIGRAVEVAHHRTTADEQLSAEDLLAIADEVGLSRPAVVTALAEARAGVDHRRRVLDRLVGSRHVWTISQLPSDHDQQLNAGDEATDILQHWLEIDHGLRTHVTADGVVTAEPRGGLTGAFASGIRRFGGSGGLDRARRVRGVVVTMDEFGSVCMVADVGNKRAEAVAGGSIIAGGTGTVVIAAGLLISPLALLALPIGALAGLAAARAIHGQNVTQVTGQIEMTTEAVVRGQQPEHPVERFIRTRVIRRPQRRSRL